jgi:hypothetical protein
MISCFIYGSKNRFLLKLKTYSCIIVNKNKFFAAMMHSGTAMRQVENFMSVMEIPGLHSSCMKARELELSSHINNVAKETCMNALQEEVELTNSTRR